MPQDGKMFSKKKIIFGILLVLPAVFTLTYFFIFSNFSENKKIIYENYSSKLQKEYDLTVAGYTKAADLIFKNMINRQDILSNLSTAFSEADESRVDILRKDLLTELMPMYKSLLDYDFRQLHFHDKKNVSFLRFHKPEKYGDDLTTIRYSVKSVNSEKIKLSGFEEGRIFNGYRNVYPLFFEGNHIGSVELSISINAIINQIKKLDDQEVEFIILKSVVLEKVFESELGNYTEWSASEKYLLDKNVNTVSQLDKGLSSNDRNRISRSLDKSLKDNTPFSVPVRLNGNSSILTFLPVRNLQDQVVAFIFSISGDDEIKEHNTSFLLMSSAFVLLMALSSFLILFYFFSNRKIESLLLFDQLTGALSRMYLFTKVTELFNHHKRYNSLLSVCMIDIDFFKKVNDRYGHPAGDSLLKELVHLIIENLRVTDFIGRYGGEEFLVLLPETDRETAYGILEKIRNTIQTHQFAIVGYITISGGIAAADETIDDAESLIEKADKCLYYAKENGRNRIVMSDRP